MEKLIYIKNGKRVKEMTISILKKDWFTVIMEEGRKVGADFVRINDFQVMKIKYDDKVNAIGSNLSVVKRKEKK